MRIEVTTPRPDSSNVLRFAVRTGATAVGLWIATLVVSGITVSGGSGWTSALTLLAVAVIFGLVNAVLKPLIKVLGILVYVVTLWLISFVVNALLLWLVSWLAGSLGLPFHVEGFWSAFWGAIIVSLVSWGITLLVPEPDRRRVEVRTFDLPDGSGGPQPLR